MQNIWVFAKNELVKCDKRDGYTAMLLKKNGTVK